MGFLRRTSCTRIVVLSFLCAVSWALQEHYDFQHDDAYISYRYAANWARGHGPVYNVDERVEGYSNFLLVAILAAAARASLDIVVTSRVLGTLSSFALVILVYLIIGRILRRGQALAILASGAIALHTGMAVWARSGLETVPFALALFLAQAQFLRENSRARQHLGSGLLFGVVALLRADGLLFAIPSLLFILRVERAPRSAGVFGAAVILFFVPWFIWHFAYYGYPFPNSYYLKTGGDFFQQLRGLHYTYNFVLPFGGVLLFALPLSLFIFRDPQRDPVRLYLGAHVFLTGMYVVLVGGDHMPMGRFYVPIVPGITVLFLESAVEIGRHLRGLSRGARLRMTSVLLACIGSAGFFPTLNSRRVPSSHAVNCRVFVEHCCLAGKWFQSNMDPEQLMATAPAGAVAYHSELRIVDMLGVNDLHIAHLEVPNMGHGSAGHEKQDQDYVLSRKPDLIFRGVSDTCEGSTGSRRGGSSVVRIYADGSRFRLRCEPLGPGPMADDFGGVRRVDLFVKFEEREEISESMSASNAP